MLTRFAFSSEIISDIPDTSSLKNSSLDHEFCRARRSQGLHYLIDWPFGFRQNYDRPEPQEVFRKINIPVVHPEGDGLRKGLTGDLGFSEEDGRENVRRVAEVAALFTQSGHISLVSLISPYAEYRLAARATHETLNLKFFEVNINTPIETCEVGDPMQLYRLARLETISNFTGVSSPYEQPVCPDLLIESGIYAIEECRDKVLRLLV